MNTLANAIRQIIEERNIKNCKQFAKLVGMNNSVVSRYLSGQRKQISLDNLDKIFVVFPEILDYIFRDGTNTTGHSEKLSDKQGTPFRALLVSFIKGLFGRQ